MLNHIHIVCIASSPCSNVGFPKSSASFIGMIWQLGIWKKAQQEEFWPFLTPPIEKKLWVNVIWIFSSSETCTVLTRRPVFLFSFRSLKKNFLPTAPAPHSLIESQKASQHDLQINCPISTVSSSSLVCQMRDGHRKLSITYLRTVDNHILRSILTNSYSVELINIYLDLYCRWNYFGSSPIRSSSENYCHIHLRPWRASHGTSSVL